MLCCAAQGKGLKLAPGQGGVEGLAQVCPLARGNAQGLPGSQGQCRPQAGRRLSPSQSSGPGEEGFPSAHPV